MCKISSGYLQSFGEFFPQFIMAANASSEKGREYDTSCGSLLIINYFLGPNFIIHYLIHSSCYSDFLPGTLTSTFIFTSIDMYVFTIKLLTHNNLHYYVISCNMEWEKPFSL